MIIGLIFREILLFLSPDQPACFAKDQSGVSPGMALRLGKFCGNGEQLWINMQIAHDLWRAKQRIGRDIDKIRTVEPRFEQ